VQQTGTEEQTTKQKFGDVEENPIRLAEGYTRQIIEQLNTDLASHFIILFQLKKHHWLVEGPDWKHIHEALDDYAKSIQEHADELAERINLLGGIPLSNPSRFAKLSYVDYEGEDKMDLRVMLQNDLEAQQITIEQFRERIQFTKKNNDFGTEDVLKDMIEEHEEIAHEIDHYLKNTSLEQTIESVNHNITKSKKYKI
jgi:starvation-inducible DNA-binding protein